MNNHFGCDEPEPPAAIARLTSNCGQPCAACQATYGAHMTAATKPPTHGHGVARVRRGPEMRIPAATATSKKPTRLLSSSPTPATKPVTNHSRSLLVRNVRTINQSRTVHANRSNVEVLSK